MPFVKTADLNVYFIEKGAGRPIVFVHGNWATCSWWEPVMERLPPGWRGIAYDVRGRGHTEGPDSTYSIPELAADLGAFVDALGLDTFDLVGHSLGSAIAMQYALDHGGRLTSLTVVSPAWVNGMPAIFNLPDDQRALKADPELFRQRLKMTAPGAPDDAFWQRLAAEGHEQRLSATLRNLPMLIEWKPGDHLKEIGVPKLVVSGALDLITGGANAERAATALGAAQVVMQDVGHSPNVEAPDALVALLLAHISAA